MARQSLACKDMACRNVARQSLACKDMACRNVARQSLAPGCMTCGNSKTPGLLTCMDAPVDFRQRLPDHFVGYSH